MSPRRSIGAAGAGLLVAALLLVGVPAGAQQASGPVEVTVDQVGWWTSRTGATATGEGGFEVATDGAGEPQSVAAAQVTVEASTVDSFTITLTESSALAEFGSIAVCHVLGLWMPENPGDLDSAPATDCSTRVNLTRTDSMTWLGDITPLVRDGGTVSLAFVPEYRPPTPFGPGIVVRIAEIGTEATGSVEAGDGPSPTTTAVAPTPAPGTAPRAPASDAPAPSPTLGSAGPPSPAPAPAPSGGSPPTTVSVPDAEPVAQQDDFFTLGPVAERSAETKPWARLALLVPLSAAVGFGSARIRRFVSERTQLAGPV